MKNPQARTSADALASVPALRRSTAHCGAIELGQIYTPETFDPRWLVFLTQVRGQRPVETRVLVGAMGWVVPHMARSFATGLYRVKRGGRVWVIPYESGLRLAGVRGERFEGTATLDAVTLFEVFRPLGHDETQPRMLGWVFLSEAQERVVRASSDAFENALASLADGRDRLAEAIRRAE